MMSASTHESESSLKKTSSRLFNDIAALLKSAEHKVEDARHIGNSRSRGYASVIVVVASIVFQWAGLVGIRLLDSKSAPTVNTNGDPKPISPEVMALTNNNLSRIETNLDAIAAVKNRVAPSMPIDSNLAAIRAATQDVRAVILPIQTPAK